MIQVLRKDKFLNTFSLFIAIYIFLVIPVIHNNFHHHDFQLTNFSYLRSSLIENKVSHLIDVHQTVDEQEQCQICNFLKILQILPIEKNSKVFHNGHEKHTFFSRLFFFSNYINQTKARSPPY